MAKNLKNFTIIAVIIIVILILIGGYFFYKNNNNNNQIVGENVLSAQEAAERAIRYLNASLLSGGVTASLLEVAEENGLYKFKLKVQENEHTSYVSKDGKILFIDGINMEEKIVNTEEEAEVSQIVKTEKPDVKLFVMSYCPYGLQTQKMFLPVYRLLKDKADMGIYFVNYIMHQEQEIKENINQYCIQEEQSEKFSDYLTCFVKDGDSKTCLSTAGVDESQLSQCFAATDKKYNIYSQYQNQSTWLNGRLPKFDVHADLNQQYGVRGSPTVVINDSVIVSRLGDCPVGGEKCVVLSDFTRTPESFKKAICGAFSSPPKECDQLLSEIAFTAGFGLEEGSGVDGGCGG